MALYSTVFEYTVYNEICQNRFHYATPVPGAVSDGALKMNQGFQADVLPAIAALMTNVGGNVSYDRLYTVNLYDDTDFNEDLALTIGAPTQNAGEAMPSFLALSYASPRFRVGKNRWYKRMAGLGEIDITGNLFNNAIAADALGAAMTSQVTAQPSGQKFNPVLLFLDPTSVPPYQLYATEGDQRLEMAQVSSWAYWKLTTQRSRILGVGI